MINSTCPEKTPVVIGFDMASPLGTRMETQWAKAIAGKSGIGPLTRFELREKYPVNIAGQVEDEESYEEYPFLKPRPMAQWTSPVFKYGMLVASRALAKAGIEITPELAPRVGTTFSTAIGGLDAIIAADRLLVGENKLPKPYANPNTCINMITGKVSILTGAKGPITTTVSACATGSASIAIGSQFLQNDMADVMICGAVDFPVIETIVAGFATMNGAYQIRAGRESESPQSASRPFSINRSGFVVSEGAGCILLATREFAQAHGLDYSIELAGWSMNSDASHFVAPEFGSIARCMSDAIRQSGLKPSDISAVNAHAASTKVGDQTEAEALAQVFNGRIPPVTANKSQIGHCMGASSAIETILAMSGMLTDTLLPTINYQPDPTIDIDCVADGARNAQQEFVLKNAFGFGGCNTCLVLRRV